MRPIYSHLPCTASVVVDCQPYIERGTGTYHPISDAKIIDQTASRKTVDAITDLADQDFLGFTQSGQKMSYPTKKKGEQKATYLDRYKLFNTACFNVHHLHNGFYS